MYVLSYGVKGHLCAREERLQRGCFRRTTTCDRGHNAVTESQAPFPPGHRSRPREQRWVTVTNQYMGVANVGVTLVIKKKNRYSHEQKRVNNY